MQNNKRQNRRRIVTVAIVLTVALSGLFMVNTGQVNADRGLDPGAVSSANPAAENNLATSAQGSFAAALIKMVSALAVVVICVYIGLYLLKRLTSRRSGPGLKNDVLEVLQTTHLGPRKTISLVRIGNRSVLVGVTEQHISTITELDQAETEDILSVEAAAEDKPDAFAGILRSATSRIKNLGLTRKQTALET